MKPAYYNEFDKNAAAWLRELIKAGMIAPGDVDERSIEDVLPNDLAGYTQCHFFAGIGVWSYALRQAGWPDDRPVWTGSCPCQPFSAAGKGKGVDDERHLWPAFAGLIAACRPPVIFGEQVASSLVTGKRTSPDLQRLWERKARLGILADWLEEDISNAMQGMPQQDGPRSSSDAQGFYCNQGVKIDGGSEITRSSQGIAIRSISGMGSGGAGIWSLRGYWNRFRHEIESGVEYTIAGSDKGGIWIYHGEHSGCSVWPERSMRELGREQGYRDGECDHGAAAEAIRRATEEIDREIDAEDGQSWIDTLQTDLEGVGYTFGAVPFPSAGVGAPHIRDRMYWVADAESNRYQWAGEFCKSTGGHGITHGGAIGRMDNADDAGLEGFGSDGVVGNGAACGMAYSELQQRQDGESGVGSVNDEAGRIEGSAEAPGLCGDNGMGNAECSGGHDWRRVHRGCLEESGGAEEAVRCELRNETKGTSIADRTGPTNGFWRSADWLGCRDGKFRPVEPGTFPLVNGASARVVRLRGYGNAVNAVQAQTWIEAFMECQQ